MCAHQVWVVLAHANTLSHAHNPAHTPCTSTAACSPARTSHHHAHRLWVGPPASAAAAACASELPAMPARRGEACLNQVPPAWNKGEILLMVAGLPPPPWSAAPTRRSCSATVAGLRPARRAAANHVACTTGQTALPLTLPESAAQTARAHLSEAPIGSARVLPHGPTSCRRPQPPPPAEAGLQHVVARGAWGAAVVCSSSWPAGQACRRARLHAGPASAPRMRR